MIKSVWIEIRPALSCGNVCVVLKKKFNSPVRIKMKKSELIVEANEKMFSVNFSDFIVEPLTMTAFRVDNQFINFRIQVSYKAAMKAFPPKSVTPPALGGEKFAFRCQCFNALTKRVTFRRISPLPLNDLSVSDLFCHVHDGSFSGIRTAPELGDCFYSNTIIRVSKEIISDCITSDKFLKCPRCLSNVGVEHRDYVNLWLSGLQLPGNHFPSLEKLKKIVRDAASDPFTVFPHILLESEELNCYLSIIVVDKNLIVSSCQQDLNLLSRQVVKVKYNFYTTFEGEVKSLKSDPFNTVSYVQVEKSFLSFCLKHLSECSKTVPPVFNKLDGACMAYLDLEAHANATGNNEIK